jgi:Ala-tRNA(Pro) deacylase
MAIAITLKQYLDEHHMPYDVMIHQRTATARETARACEISNDCLAKAVLMRDGGGYVVAVLPASCQVDRERLAALLGRAVDFADEDEMGRLFGDCEMGAIPALGQAYGLETILDHHLEGAREVWMEAGDHERLIHMPGEAFRELMRSARHGAFTHR